MGEQFNGSFHSVNPIKLNCLYELPPDDFPPPSLLFSFNYVEYEQLWYLDSQMSILIQLESRKYQVHCTWLNIFSKYLISANHN
ncbi:hypothetical protein FGO68_gene11456 [Halteria grandinella]|uniref:Uncharacterized protein n=1 Tax=Halteria grandinella TaxID=5974 RepID=A0A8J8NW17_HALGN|nr:hypothetical protein FGO68_gene11456 [Halteria grandinella]